MDIKERSKQVLNALFQEAADSGAENIYVDKAVKLLKSDGFEVLMPDAGQGPFGFLILGHPETGEQLGILYPRGMIALDGDNNEIVPMLYRQNDDGSLKSADFLVDFIAAKLWNDKEESTGYKFVPPVL